MEELIRRHWKKIFLFVGITTLTLPFFLTRDFGLISFVGLGDVGDVIGGTTAPFLSIFGSVLVYLALRSQIDANAQIQQQFKTQKSSSQFYTMLDLHNKNVEAFRINSFESFDGEIRYKLKTHGFTKSEKCSLSTVISTVLEEDHQVVRFKVLKPYKKHLKPKDKLVEGRRCFSLMNKDLHFALYCIDKINNKLDEKLELDDLLALSYKVFFWGTNSAYLRFEDGEKYKITLQILDKLNELIRLIRHDAKGDKIVFDYFTNNGKALESKYKQEYFRFIPLCGHSSRLAHYFRHLYQTVKQIHFDIEQENISLETGHLFLSTLRAQMSNEEQLLLYYNYIIGFGSKWDKRYDRGDKNDWGDFEFLTKYKMIHNIPLYNTIYEKVLHPENQFEKFILKNPEFDLFEWSRQQKVSQTE